MSAQPSRQFIIRVDEGYAVPRGYDLIRVLGTEERLTGTGTATQRTYVVLAEEVPDE